MSTTTNNTLKGIVRGKVIELTEEPGLPDGQEVTVVLQATVPEGMEGLLQSAGACADEADDLDKFLEWSRQQRKSSRPPIEP